MFLIFKFMFYNSCEYKMVRFLLNILYMYTIPAFYIHKFYNFQRLTRNVNKMVCLTFKCVRKFEFIFLEPRKKMNNNALRLKFTSVFCGRRKKTLTK